VANGIERRYQKHRMIGVRLTHEFPLFFEHEMEILVYIFDMKRLIDWHLRVWKNLSKCIGVMPAILTFASLTKPSLCPSHWCKKNHIYTRSQVAG
jgi:hypothetical protein